MGLHQNRAVVRLLTAVALAGSVATGCASDDGRSLPPVDPALTTTTTTADPAAGTDAGGVASVFTLRSSGFADGEALPAAHTCDGEGISPGLSWEGTPADAVELAVVAREVAAGTLHWVVTGIQPFVQGFGDGGLPENAVEGLNAGGAPGWLAPCPEAGTGTHLYELVLHALDEPVPVGVDGPGEAAAAAIEAASVAQAVLTGTVAAPDDT